MPWIRADDVFAAADAEEEALQPSPWLQRRRGPMRKPDEHLMTKRNASLSPEERLSLNAVKIRETEQALAGAGPDEVFGLKKSLAMFRAKRSILLNGHR